jgi:transketolase
MIRYAAEVEGPVYIRTGRSSIPFIYKKEYKFNPAQADELVSGENILIVSTGVLIKEAMVACQMLAKDNLFPGLLNLHTLKPLDEKKLANYAKKYKTVVTFEEHSIHGGLGAVVAKALSAHTPKYVHCFGMERFGKSGTPTSLLDKFGLDAKAIRKKVLQIAKKN